MCFGNLSGGRMSGEELTKIYMRETGYEKRFHKALTWLARSIAGGRGRERPTKGNGKTWFEIFEEVAGEHHEAYIEKMKKEAA